MKTKIRPGLLAITIAIPLCIGGLSAMLTGNMMKEYFDMNKPVLSPPGWVFPIAWTVLYVLMGVASYLVITSGADRTQIVNALIFYGIQLILNFFWSIIFFNYMMFLWALIELLTMWAVIIVTTALFFRISTGAGWLMVPYILWSTFAAYLNFEVYRMSRAPMPLPR